MGNSDQNQTEVEIERIRTALEAEFEEFVSMAAHNLRESLRDVASFSQLMAETYAGRLDSDAGLFLDRIQEGAASMQSLLADVVTIGLRLPATGRSPGRTWKRSFTRRSSRRTSR